MPELYPYQRDGIAQALAFYVRGNHGVLLADDMGLGKTAQALAIADALGARHVLVVCPSSVKLNWIRESGVWHDRPRAYHLIEGRGRTVLTPGFPLLTVVNYDILKDTDFGDCDFDLIIYDEAHRLMNPEAKRTLGAAQIPSKRRLLLTGTPMRNRPKELWQLLCLCGVVVPSQFHDYGLKYCAAWLDHEWRSQGRGRNRKAVRKEVWNYDGASNLEELGQHLRRLCMIRRRKTDVLKDLPAKTRQIVELPEQSYAATDVLVSRALADLRQLKFTRSMLAQKYGDPDFGKYKSMVDRLQCDISVCFEQISLLRHETALSKIPQVLDYVGDAMAETDKLVLWAYHRDVIDALAEGLKSYCPLLIVGGMTDEAKQWTLDRFQNHDECRIFIGQIDAAGTGVDGLQNVCSTAVFVELPWSPADLNQAEDRLCRIGQKEPVLILHLVLQNSLDCRIAKTLVRKQKDLDTVTDGGAEVDWIAELA